MLLRLTALLFSSITVVRSINCYNGVAYNNSATPKEQISCPYTSFCTKITAVTPVSLASYGCDQSASLCKMSDCYQNQNGGKTCCCSSDLCNISNPPMTWTLVLTAAWYFVMF